MQTADFLARAVAPGNYTLIGYNNGPGTDINRSRMFLQSDTSQIIGFLKWCISEKTGLKPKPRFDAFHAQASFKAAEPDGNDPLGHVKYKGERLPRNLQRLKSFWIDLDVKRVGDKKNAANSFVSQAAALQWLAGFRGAYKLPRLSMCISSGYGVHAYWVLEQDMSHAEWQPYADALRAALIQHRFPCDAGITSDCVRFLRPVGTVNVKDGTPMPVQAFDKLSGPDVPNQLMLAALQPCLSLVTQRAASSATQVAGTAHALAGGSGSVSALFTGAGAPNMAAAAAANLPARADRLFARMAEPTGCEQIKTSLANHGAGDPYPLWYLGFLSAAHFCSDGAQYIHPIGDGDPRYSAAATDAAMSRIAHERRSKAALGWPSCAHFERARPAVCQACPHNGRVASPLDLATTDGDLPKLYRRSRGNIEVMLDGPQGSVFWSTLLKGDVFGPMLDEHDGMGFMLTFKYEFSGRTYDVYVSSNDLTSDASAVYKLFSKQHLVPMPGNELRWRTFILAWIEQIRENHQTRNEKVSPFGWAEDGAKHLGFAYAGVLHRADGTQESARAGDRVVFAMHKPQGDLAKWQQAAQFALTGRVDLHALVACSFAAPLVRLTGHKGLLVSAWSRESGVGKSSAITVGQGVWGAPGAGMSLDDTQNSVRHKIAETHHLPAYWDEMRVGNSIDDSTKFVQFVFAITQGRERSRLNRDATMQAAGEWETMVICCSNNPLMDQILAHTQGTEAGALRLFEFRITHPPMPQDAAASATIQLATRHFGRAGEIYARWLATNHDSAKQALQVLQQGLIARTGAMQAERLYIATMATILMGARIANKLGLLQFDLPGLETFLIATFMTLRAERGESLLVTSTGYDLEEILATFWNENLRNRIITDAFQIPGAPPIKTVLVHQNCTGIDIHVSQQDQIMRINRSRFWDYVRKRAMPPTDVVRALDALWGAKTARRIMGAGTAYGGGGQIFTIDIPLIAPELQSYLQAGLGQSSAAPSLAATLQAPMPPTVAALAAAGVTP